MSDGKERLEDFFRNFVIVGGEGTINLEDEDPVHIGVIYEVWSNVGGGAAIYVDQNRYHASGDTAVQEAFDIYQNWLLDYHKDDKYLEELQEEWGDEWLDILTETVDGFALEMTPQEFAEVFEANKDKFDKADIEIYDSEEI